MPVTSTALGSRVRGRMGANKPHPEGRGTASGVPFILPESARSCSNSYSESRWLLALLPYCLFPLGTFRLDIDEIARAPPRSKKKNLQARGSTPVTLPIFPPLPLPRSRRLWSRAVIEGVLSRRFFPAEFYCRNPGAFRKKKSPAPVRSQRNDQSTAPLNVGRHCYFMANFKSSTSTSPRAWGEWIFSRSLPAWSGANTEWIAGFRRTINPTFRPYGVFGGMFFLFSPVGATSPASPLQRP